MIFDQEKADRLREEAEECKTIALSIAGLVFAALVAVYILGSI